MESNTTISLQNILASIQRADLMTAVMTSPQPTRAESLQPPPPLADASMLEDKVPEGLKASRVLAGFSVFVGLLFLFLSFRPLWHTDLWGHLAYGRTLVMTRSLPATEPLMPLASGVPFVDTAWLTQVIGYAMFERFGITSMSFLYATSITLMAVLLLYRGYQRSQCVGITLAGLLLWMWGCWQHLNIIRPQLAGMMCFTILLTLVTSRHRRPWHWFAVPMLFTAWANLHGSFFVGFVLLAGLAAGRAIDLAVRCGEFRAVRRDSQVRRYVLMLELAAVATLLNPYGLGLYAEVLSISNNPNVAELVEWSPLQLRMSQGQATAVIGMLLMVLYRMSPRRVTSAEVLLLFGFGAAALWSSRMLVWWIPLAAYYGVVHASAIWHTLMQPLETLPTSPRNGRWSVITVGAIWFCVAITPFGGRLLHGDNGKLKVARMVSSQTPLGVVQYLKKMAEEKKIPRGQAFNTYEWGDYLLWSGPKEVKVFVASHAHLIPREVWSDYVAISNGSADWDDRLDRYGVNLIILDEATHDGLIRKLRENDQWSTTYSDNVGTVFVRKKPI